MSNEPWNLLEFPPHNVYGEACPKVAACQLGT